MYCIFHSGHNGDDFRNGHIFQKGHIFHNDHNGHNEKYVHYGNYGDRSLRRTITSSQKNCILYAGHYLFVASLLTNCAFLKDVKLMSKLVFILCTIYNKVINKMRTKKEKKNKEKRKQSKEKK